MRKPYTATFIAGIVLMLTATLAHGQSFSVVAGGPTPAPGDDILNPGPIPVLPGSIAGPPLSPVLEVNAFSWGHHTDFVITDYQFSIDPASVGALGAAGVEFAGAGFGPGDHPADIYNSIGTGGNTLLWDGDGLANPGVAPALGLVEPGGDDVDGWDNRLGPAPAIFFSLDLATAPLVGAFAADVLVAPSAPAYDLGAVLYAPAPALGLDLLGPGTDDIDALVVFDHSGSPGVFDAADYILFSLTPGSASLGAASGTAYAGFGAEDILIATVGGGGLHLPGIALGLSFGDNLDALDVIPEPNVVLLILAGGTGLYIRKRLTRY